MSTVLTSQIQPPKRENAVREFLIPCGDSHATIPYPIDEERFELLMKTLELWKPILAPNSISQKADKASSKAQELKELFAEPPSNPVKISHP